MSIKQLSIKSEANILDDLFVKPTIWRSLLYINLIFAYFGIIFLISRQPVTFAHLFVYVPFIYLIHILRQQRQEQFRKMTAHRMPFFADALANSLAVGNTLEKALSQSSYYLHGGIKEDIERLIIKCSLGKDIRELLRELERKYPNTGFKYVTALLDQYRELGVGISPILKRIAVALGFKEEAEHKILTVLAAGSSYAKMSVGLFVCMFIGMSYFMRDQIHVLLSDDLRPVFLFLIGWLLVGVVSVMRMTSMDFCRKFALRPDIRHYLEKKKFSTAQLLHYSGFDWSSRAEQCLFLLPAITGFCFAGLFQGTTTLNVILSYAFGGALGWLGINFVLKGMVEDELIKTTEVFPDLLQVFIIGLNSGLNIYKAFDFAQTAIRHNAPKILSEELCRTKFAMECGEDHFVTWKRFAEMLPFETVADFAEVMVVAPMHGESIVASLDQMQKSYESKKLLAIEKTAVQMGQMVIPVVVLAFFPIFLFSVFAPLVLKITNVVGQ